VTGCQVLIGARRRTGIASQVGMEEDKITELGLYRLEVPEVVRDEWKVK
jgi:hypothetical protein